MRGRRGKPGGIPASTYRGSLGRRRSAGDNLGNGRTIGLNEIAIRIELNGRYTAIVFHERLHGYARIHRHGFARVRRCYGHIGRGNVHHGTGAERPIAGRSKTTARKRLAALTLQCVAHFHRIIGINIKTLPIIVWRRTRLGWHELNCGSRHRKHAVHDRAIRFVPHHHGSRHRVEIRRAIQNYAHRNIADKNRTHGGYTAHNKSVFWKIADYATAAALIRPSVAHNGAEQSPDHKTRDGK